MLWAVLFPSGFLTDAEARASLEMLLFFLSYLRLFSQALTLAQPPKRSLVQIDLEISLDKTPVHCPHSLGAVLLAIPDYLDVRAEAAAAGLEVHRD